MSRFLRWLISGDGHNHKYELFETLYLISNLERVKAQVSNQEPHKKGFIYLSRCSHCGKIKTDRVTV